MHFDFLSLLNFVDYSINSYWILRKQKKELKHDAYEGEIII